MHYLEIGELSSLLRSGATTALELTTALLDRIERMDPRLGTYREVLRDAATAEAERRDAELRNGRDRGPLHGVPLAVKDLYAVAGVPTGAGTTVLAEAPASRDSVVVARLREAGAIILGTHQMSEGAFAAHHPLLRVPLNPWDPDLWVGASSSGSAAATAAGLCYASLGSDTGGSIRFPSAATGLTGLKPTWGRVPRTGTIEFAASLDSFGPLARSAADCAIVYDAVAGPDSGDPSSLLPTPVPLAPRADTARADGVRIGVDPAFMDICDGPTTGVIRAALEVLAGLGAEIVEVRLPDVERMIDDWTPACAVEASIAHADAYPAHADVYGEQLRELLELGHAMTAIEHETRLRRRRAFTAQLAESLADVDLLAVQVTGIAAPRAAFLDAIGVGPEWRDLIMRATCPFNAAGVPSITLPGGADANGAPIGFQLVGKPLREDRAMQAAIAFQSVTEHHRRHPEPFL